MWLFAILAAVGFVLSMVVHALTIVGINPTRWFQATWLLHLGIFVAFVPALIATSKMRKAAPKSDDAELTRKFTPPWLRHLTAAFFVYGIINFLLTIFCLFPWGRSTRLDRVVLRPDGKVVKKLEPRESEQFKANELRLFSGHWMFFYIASLEMLVAHQRAGKKQAPDLSHWFNEHL